MNKSLEQRVSELEKRVAELEKAAQPEADEENEYSKIRMPKPNLLKPESLNNL